MKVLIFSAVVALLALSLVRIVMHGTEAEGFIVYLVVFTGARNWIKGVD